MRAITLHNIDEELYQMIVAEARNRGASINSTAKKILGDSLGTTKPAKKRDLSMLVGMWTKEEGEAFDKIIEETSERIDPEDWK